MKQLICVLLAALMLLVLFTGCGKTEVPIVKGEPEATLAKGTEWTAVPQEKVNYEVPDRFTGEWTGIDDTFTVTADAEIILPEDVSQLCTAKVKRHTFTQEEANRIIKIVLKGNPLYQVIDLSKEQCQEAIDDFEACLRGEKEYTGDGTLERLPEVIAWYKEQMKTAPHENELIPADTFREGGFGEEIRGYGEVDGKKIYCDIENSNMENLLFDRMKIWEEGYGTLNGLLITEDSTNDNSNLNMRAASFEGHEGAIKVGDEYLKKLGLEGYVCNALFPVKYCDEQYEPTGETGMQLDYVRKINGLPLTKTNFPGHGWLYERISVYVLGEERVVYFRWDNPYEVSDVQPCGKLKDFSEIQEVFEPLFFAKNDYWRSINQKNGTPTYNDVHIDKVQLTLARVSPKDSSGEGTIIPVWDFWGSENGWMMWNGEKQTGQPHYSVVMTINALDGTMIDREIGY